MRRLLGTIRFGEVKSRMPNKKRSVFREGMVNAHYEAVSSTIFMNLIAGPYLTGYLLFLGADASQLGLILSIPLLANAIVVILSAYLMEYYPNRYRTTLISILFHRIFLLGTGLIPFVWPKADWVPVFIVLFVIGCMSGSLSATPSVTLLADLVPRKFRANYFGIRFTLGGIAASVTLLTIGWGLDRLPMSTGFALLYCCGLAVSLLNMVHYGRYPNLLYSSAGNSLSWKFMFEPLRDRSFFKAVLFVSFWLMAQGATISLFSYVMLELMKTNYAWMGISNTLLTVVSIGATFIWGRLNMKWSTRKLLLWVFPLNAIAVLFWGLQAFLPDTLMLIIVYTMLGISLSGFNLLTFQYVISDTPKEGRSMYYAVWVSITSLFGFFGPLVGGKLLNSLKSWPFWFQEYGLFVCIGALMLAASLSISFIVFSAKQR
ncbi:MFS transporter [Paenibacillus montanisoli]|nr:MFS transporter [Paenibacillus montanisoli]